MKKPTWILIGGLALGGISGMGAYWFQIRHTAYRNAPEQFPELKWLQDEFKVSPEALQRINALHEEQVAQCEEICREADVVNRELQSLLATSHEVTPEIQAKLDEANRIRTECQTKLLRYLFRVSRELPEGQAGRYLTWAQSNVFCTPSLNRHHGDPFAHHP